MTLRNADAAGFPTLSESFDVRRSVLMFPEIPVEALVADYFEMIEYELTWYRLTCLPEEY